MFKKYLLSSVFRDAENEKGAINKIRDQIPVTHNQKDDDGNVIEDKKEEVKEEVKPDEVQATETEKEVETAEEETETDKDSEKIQRIKEKSEKRIQKEVAKRKALEEELASARSKLAETDKDKLYNEEDAKKLANEIAEQTLTQRQFINACNKLAEDALKVDKTFSVKVDAMAKEVGPIPPVMIGILEDLDNGGAVLNHLTDNTDDAERIYNLSPPKMALELAKISSKISKPKPVVKEISKVPDPAKPLGGKLNQATTTYSDKDSTKDWVEKRNREVEERRRSGRVNLR